MNRGLDSSVAALGAAEKRLETIAANLANSSAPGFKRSGTASFSFDALLGQRIERRVAARTTIDYTQGPLKPTEGTFDIALHGTGFFTVEGAQGELYTRDGRFFADDKGVLQTMDGLPVAWEGARGTVDPGGAAVTVDTEGIVRQGDQTVGRLRIVDFEHYEQLEHQGGGFFAAPRNVLPIASEALVRQGQLEQANVSPIDEMVALIAVQRQFEAGTRLLQTIDQSYRRLTTPR